MPRVKKRLLPKPKPLKIHPAVVERNMEKLGAWLKAQRLAQNHTLREAARLGSCSDSWLCQIEGATCDIGATTAKSLPKLAAAYKLPVNTLFEAILRALGHHVAE